MARSKKEIDKELMYKKLMPSARRPAKAPEAEAESEQRTPAAPAGAPAQEKPPEARDMSPHRVSVPTLDNHKTVIVNTMEPLVLAKLSSVLARFKCCRCDRCKKILWRWRSTSCPRNTKSCRKITSCPTPIRS